MWSWWLLWMSEPRPWRSTVKWTASWVSLVALLPCRCQIWRIFLKTIPWRCGWWGFGTVFGEIVNFSSLPWLHDAMIMFWNPAFTFHPARCEVLLAKESFAEPQQSASWWSISEEPDGADQKLWGFGTWYWLTHDLHVMRTSSRYGSSKLQHSLVIHQDITYCWKAKVGFGDMRINCWVVQISWKENPFWQICPLRLYACKMSPQIFGTSHQLESCIWTAQKKGLHPLKIPATPLQDTLIYMLGVAAQSLKAREVPATTGPRFWEGWYNTDTLVKWT